MGDGAGGSTRAQGRTGHALGSGKRSRRQREPPARQRNVSPRRLAGAVASRGGGLGRRHSRRRNGRFGGAVARGAARDASSCGGARWGAAARRQRLQGARSGSARAAVVRPGRGLTARRTGRRALRTVVRVGSVQQQPTAVVAAATDHSVAQRAQRVFSTSYFRVYSHTDVVGVELAGALKNVIALAAGILEGLGLGFNTRAALITRGLAEMTRLGVKLGAQPLTFAGLAGMGDLILTATGALSRNRTLGVALGQGKTLEQALAGKPAVVEGVNTTRTAVALGERHGVELPIACEVANVLFHNKPPRQAVSDLMERELKAESR